MTKHRPKLNAKLSRKSISWIKRHINELHPTIDSVVQMLIYEYESHASLRGSNTIAVSATTA